MKELQCLYDWIIFSSSIISIRIDEQGRKQAHFKQQRLDLFISTVILPVSSEIKEFAWGD